MHICPFVQRTVIALKIKNVPFTLCEMSLGKPRPEWFLKLNPEGKCPVLEHEGEFLNESYAIVDFVEELHPNPPLYPVDLHKRAFSRVFVKYLNDEFVPTLYKFLMNRDPSKEEEVYNKSLETFRWIDTFLRKHNPNPAVQGRFMWSDEFGICEVMAASFFQRYCIHKHYKHFELPDTEEYARVRQYKDAITSHPLVISTAPIEQDMIKMYYDYTLGVSNGKAVPADSVLGYNSFDVEDHPLEDREIPPPHAVPEFLKKPKQS